MVVAHAVSASGPHIEVLIVAGGFFLLGVVFFVQKSVKPLISLALVALGLVMGTGAFVLSDSAPAAEEKRVVLQDPKPGEVVPANEPFRLRVAIVGGKLASSQTATDGGHLHLIVDGAILPNMPTTTTPMAPPLEPGKHELAVEYVGPDHVSFRPRVIDTIEITAKKGA